MNHDGGFIISDCPVFNRTQTYNLPYHSGHSLMHGVSSYIVMIANLKGEDVTHKFKGEYNCILWLDVDTFNLPAEL